MTRRDVTEAEVQARLDVLRAGQPWSGLGAAVTVMAIMVIVAERWLRGEGVATGVVYAIALALAAVGIVFQLMGRRRRKAFVERTGRGR